MIDIKVIKKPKNEGSTSALRTGAQPTVAWR